MKDIHDANVMQTKTFELTREIMAAQSYAMEAAAAQTALLARVRELEEEISKLETWSTEKARYQLREVNTGVFAYVPKQGMEQGEPFHMLCANCYERGEKSILQATQELRMRRLVHVCPRCKTELEWRFLNCLLCTFFLFYTNCSAFSLYAAMKALMCSCNCSTTVKEAPSSD